MDEMANRAILIATGIFVTIIIVTGLFYVMSQMRDIYSQVYETNISLQDMFSEFDEYDNTKKTGIDVLNAMKKYKDNDLVVIKINNIIKNKAVFIESYSEESKQVELGQEVYSSIVAIDNNTGKITISFKK